MNVPGVALASPLTPALSRVGEILPTFQVRENADDTAPGWVRVSDLAIGGSALDTFLAWDDERILQDYGRRGRPEVVASFALHRYAWPASLLFTIPYFLLRRVPWLSTDAVAVKSEGGGLSVQTSEFSCLADDPDAGAPGARVVSEEQLQTDLRVAAAEHLGPVLTAFGPRMRRRSRALWGVATDELAGGLWYVGSLLGEEERARAEAERLLPGATAPYAGGAGFRTLTGPDGKPLVTRNRVSCCLYYTLRPQDTCVTCPRTCDAERVERLSRNR